MQQAYVPMSGVMHWYGCLMLEAEYMSTNVKTVTNFSINSHVVCGGSSRVYGLNPKP